MGCLIFFFKKFFVWFKKKLKTNQSRTATCQWGPRNSAKYVSYFTTEDHGLSFFVGLTPPFSLKTHPGAPLIMALELNKKDEIRILFNGSHVISFDQGRPLVKVLKTRILDVRNYKSLMAPQKYKISL